MKLCRSKPFYSGRRAPSGRVAVFTVILSCALPALAQSVPPVAANDALQELQIQVRELKQLVVTLQQQTVASHAEITRLREELESRLPDNAPASTIDEPSPAFAASSAPELEQKLGHLGEDQQLLSAKIDEQYQTKVESASKYRIRLSGIVLFNLFGNSGSVDNQDVPTWATPANPGAASGSSGATMRQSILGFEAFGPDFMGAHSSANVNFDFGGGFPSLNNGVNSGLVRLRTAAVRLDWEDTSLIAGQDQLFLSPDAPSSFASLLVPALSYAGNLWSWTPQLRVEHRVHLSSDSLFTVQGAFLDPLTGEPPDAEHYASDRVPDAGEWSRQPAYAARLAYSHPLFGQTFTFGAGGYYSRQNWGYGRTVNGWAGTMDASLPLPARFGLSAELYRGAAIGGLGAALGRSVLFNGPLSNEYSNVEALNTVGGWAQLKFRATSKLELNGAFGLDNPFASDLRAFGEQSSSYAPFYVTRNRSAFGNVIYRPRSDLVTAVEYRRLRTFSIYDNGWQANQVNMSVGVLF